MRLVGALALVAAACCLPATRRPLAVAVLLCGACGALRAEQLAGGTPVQPERVAGAVLLLETRPAAQPGVKVPAVRAWWQGHLVMLVGSRFGPTQPRVARGQWAQITGTLQPLAARSLEGRWRRAGVRGTLRVERLRPLPRGRGGPAGLIDAASRRATDQFRAAGGERAGAMLSGLALGQADEIAAADQEALRRSGLWHLAAASGGNIALVIALCFGAGWFLRLGDRTRLGLSAASVVLYVPLAGAGPSIQRAGLMGLVALATLARGHEPQPARALAAAALVTLLWQPWSWMEPGWQLSFAAVAALLLGAGPARRALERLGVPRPVASALSVTAIATLATAPIMLATFGELSLVGLLSNLVAGPLAAVAVWSGCLSAVAAIIAPPFAGVLALPGLISCRAILAVAGWAAERPHAVLTPSTAPLALAVLLALAIAPLRGRLRLALAAALLGLTMLIQPRPPSEPRLVVLDIGQGSAALLQDRHEAVLVDAGPVDAPLVRQLRALGVRRLRVVVLSHPAADHDGGAAAVLSQIPTQLVLDGGEPGGGPTHAAAMRAARQAHTVVRPVRAGQRLRVGRISMEVWWPTPRAARRPGDPNDRAAVIDARIGSLRALIPADAEGNVLRTLPGLAGDVLVVSHHGSDDPDLPVVLARMRPAVAVISVGEGNTYGHPTPATLGALRQARVPTLRTDRDGSIEVRREGRQVLVRRLGS